MTNPNKALWEKGDFTRIAQTMRESAEALVDGLGVKPGLKVLDLGCGDGTTALPQAKRGADVLGVDVASNLVAAGNAVVPSPHPRSKTLRPLVMPRLFASASPLSFMLAAMRVKSPFSQSALFGFVWFEFMT